MMKRQVTALVPMKGHSARIPGKNIKRFCGMPLLCRVLDALGAAKRIGRIVVDTDSEKIRAVVRAHDSRIMIIDRPENIRGDFVSMNDVIGHDIAVAGGDHFLQTHSTNPLLSSSTVDKAVDMYFSLLKRGYDSLFSVIRHQARFYDKDVRPVNHDPGNLIRTQDLDPLYEESSTFYIFSRMSFSRGRRRIGSKPYLYEISSREAVDIDEPDDFAFAESIYRSQRGK